MAFTNARDLTSILQLNDLALTESNHAEVVKKIMDTAAELCRADGCLFYNVNDEKFLSLTYLTNKSLKITRRGSDNLVYAPTIFLPEQKNRPQKSIAETCFLPEALSTAIIFTPIKTLTTTFSAILMTATIMPQFPS